MFSRVQRLAPLALNRGFATAAPKKSHRLMKSVLALGAGGLAIWYGWDSIRATKFYWWCADTAMPLVRRLDPEKAHRAGVLIAKYHLAPVDRSFYPELKTSLMGLDFNQCVGIAAGFDKQAEAINELFKSGLAFLEVGGITPKAQPGNPSPRMFRLYEDEAIINRFGLNSEGHSAIVPRLQKEYLRQQKHRLGLIGVNLADNKGTPDPVEDYIEGIKNCGPYSDFMVLNISCPNQVGTTALQQESRLREMLDRIYAYLNTLPHHAPLLVKLSPDLLPEEREQIARLVLEYGVDGMVISNTTVSRPDSLKSAAKTEKGGLSGKPLKEKSTETIREMYRLTEGKVPIIGVGGIASGEDAYEKIKAGASAVEVYSALVYHGMGLVPKIKKELSELLEKDGYANVSEAVGKDVEL
ncbi:dihydroorotate dehydrogenase (quinone) [Blastocystis sp. ATCC 50177/Nand II]|uniref:Dihydroorotate dehydrogenase (quinone), mitochondrial n=1 Tax=Blastocystis sp. subtype 1 (strain ATCC 50177 / NandII) TaxID=478820 RepID=A0A196SJQ3_BLAHN|nr:dihydroorotate dehydrogenase (quinone) [Blastocystis sp. ATCC 50177/Nand II]